MCIRDRRKAEVMATMDEYLKLREIGKSESEAYDIITKSIRKPTKHASGGIVGQLHLNDGGRVPMFLGGNPLKWGKAIKNYLRKKAADKKFMADLDKKLFDKKGNLNEGALEKHFKDMTDDFQKQIDQRKKFLTATPPKGRKPNAEGGRVSYTKGGLAHVLGV